MSASEYRVGSLYYPDRRSWPERAAFQYRGGAYELLLFLERPTAGEITDVRYGDAEFALLVSPPAIVFCYRFGRMPWSDSPYTIHLLPREEWGDLDAPVFGEQRALLTVILVDASDGRIRGLRAVSLSPAFTDELRLAIREQAGQEWGGEAAYDRAIDRIYRQYPTSEAFVQAAGVRCRGGD